MHVFIVVNMMMMKTVCIMLHTRSKLHSKLSSVFNIFVVSLTKTVGMTCFCCN